MNRWIICLALLGTLSNLNVVVAALKPGDPLVTVQVENPKDLHLVNALDRSIETLSAKVTACVKAGSAPAVCQCQNPKDIAAMKSAYTALLKQRPEWAEKSLSFKTKDDAGRVVSGAIALPVLQQQIDMLKCQ